MGIILKLTLRYMRKNRKRTIAAAAAITVTMMILTSVNIFANTFLGMLADDVIKNEGSYHVIFHELTVEQCRQLEQSEKIKSCETVANCMEHPDGNTLCAKAEMVKVSHGIFGAAQRLAKKIGMPRLPRKEWTQMANRSLSKYQVSYHMELLEYLGLTTYDWMGVGLLINVVLAMLLGLGCVLIYNAYAISVFEKLKYLGILGSAGASGYQKAFVVYWEGIIEGLVGIPAGIGAGCLLSKSIIFGIQEFFLYEGVSLDITPRLLGKLVLLGWIMIFAACFFPARKAVKTSSMALVRGQYYIGEEARKRTNLLKARRVFGTVGMLAMKNVWVRRKNYIANGIVLIIAFCLLLDGFAAMRGMNGDYYIRDKRKKPELSLWTEVNSDDPEKIDAFYEKISALPGVKRISMERELDLSGVLIQKEQLQEGLDDCDILSDAGYSIKLQPVKDVSSGKQVEGYIFPAHIIGIDPHTFKSYVKKAGYEIPDGESSPALLEDYVEVRTKEGTVRRSVLNLQPGEDFGFLYSRFGDLSWFNLGIHNEIDELREGRLRLIGTTKEAPDYPYYSGDLADPDGYQELGNGDIRIYMPSDAFEKLVNSPEYKDTYGIHPVDTKVNNYLEQKDIPAYIKFDIEREKRGGERSAADRLFWKELSLRMEEDKKIERMIEKLAAECGLGKARGQTAVSGRGYFPGKDTYTFGSAAISRKEEYFHSDKLLLQILGYGIILLILSLSLTNIFQNISMSMRVRRREFAAYQSMGMAAGTLKRMLIAENSLYGLAAGFIGIPLSLCLLHDVFREFERWRTIRRVIPWDMIGFQLAVACVLVAAPVAHAMMQFKHLNIIEAIRDESI